jgi:hypothetical protein
VPPPFYFNAQKIRAFGARRDAVPIFIRNLLIAFFGYFLFGWLFLISANIFAPFISDLPPPTKFRMTFAFASVCLALIAAYDALSHLGNHPWTDKALAIANVICALLGAYLASALTSIPLISNGFKPPMQWGWAAAAGSAIHLYGFWSVERLSRRRTRSPSPEIRPPTR